MNVSLTDHYEKYIQKKVKSGQYYSASEVVRDALRLLEEQDQLKEWKLEELRREIQKGIDSGTPKPWDKEEFKKKAQARLGAEPKPGQS